MSDVVNASIRYYRAKNAIWNVSTDVNARKAAYRELRKARIAWCEALEALTREKAHPMMFDEGEVSDA